MALPLRSVAASSFNREASTPRIVSTPGSGDRPSSDWGQLDAASRRAAS